MRGSVQGVALALALVIALALLMAMAVTLALALAIPMAIAQMNNHRTTPLSAKYQCISIDDVLRYAKVFSGVLVGIHTPGKVIAILSATIQKATAPGLSLKRLGAGWQQFDRAALAGSKSNGDKKIGRLRTHGILRKFRLLRSRRIRIANALIRSSQLDNILISPSVDQNRASLPGQKIGLTRLHISDIHPQARHIGHLPVTRQESRQKNVGDTSESEIQHQLDGDAQFKSALLGFGCGWLELVLMHAVYLVSVPDMSVRN